MKVLFLDIDGVCNCQETFIKDPNAHFPIDRYMAFMVGKIQLDTGCKVVLSSSWRHHKESTKYINDRIVDLLDTTGYEPHDDSRPSGAANCQRGREIQAWLNKWNSKTIISGYEGQIMNESITAYAILDDDSDMLPEQKENFFQTSWLTGLTEEIMNKVIKHLNK